jgi:hypothetical protein
MQDVETPSLTTKTYRLPKDLLRPPFQEISTETLFSVEPELGVDAPDIEYIRDVMEDIGTGLVFFHCHMLLLLMAIFSLDSSAL